MKPALALLAAAALLLPACGYSTRSLLPTQYHTIFVQPVQNDIQYMDQDERHLYIPGLETRVRASLTNRFLFDGGLRVATEDTADLVLQAKLISFEREDLRIDNNDDVREYRLRVTVAMLMTDAGKDGKVIWNEPAFSGESTYYVSGPLAKAESVAVEEALTDLARRAVARTVEDW